MCLYNPINSFQHNTLAVYNNNLVMSGYCAVKDNQINTVMYFYIHIQYLEELNMGALTYKSNFIYCPLNIFNRSIHHPGLSLHTLHLPKRRKQTFVGVG